jgi:hypothetical protein
MFSRFLLKSAASASLNLRKEFICALAKKWPHEYRLLCQPMKYSPSALHRLVNLREEELPSSILLTNNLLLDAQSRLQTSERYDRRDYVELNRGMSSALSLFYILRGDCHPELVEGQKEESALSKELYQQLHAEFQDLFKQDELWDEQMLDVLFYAVLFNDLGKNIELKKILHELYQKNDQDHDLILRNALQIDGLLKDFSLFNPAQQHCLRTMWHGGFNPSSFDTLEYPLSLCAHWVMSFGRAAKGRSNLYLAMKKIEILADIAGVQGNTSKGAINLTRPVVEKFNKSFAMLKQLFAVYQQHIDAGITDDLLIHADIEQKLKALLLDYAKKLGIVADDQEFAPRDVLVLRVSKMLGINEPEKISLIVAALKKIEEQHPESYELLLQEFSWTQDAVKPTLWLECIPKFLWLMSNGCNFDLLDKDSVPNSIARRENGLYAGLLIVSNILKTIRDSNRYEELYAFEENELTRVSSDKAQKPAIALFVAYELVQFAQKASALNLDEQSRQEGINGLKSLWGEGVSLEGRSIKIYKAPEAIPQSSVVARLGSFFDSQSIPPEVLSKQQQEWFELITKETNEHCDYLASIGLEDRASYFKVKLFVYRDLVLSALDMTRFKQTMPLPERVLSFDPQEKNTLFVDSESTAKDQEQEINRALKVRLYPTIQRLIKEHGASIFLGSNIELQAYTTLAKEKLIIEIEVPSSVKFYIALDNTGRIKVYIAGLVSHENLMQQLITLKLAGIDLRNIAIRGDTQHYKTVCRDDLADFQKQAAPYLAKRNVLIVAGCSLEETVCNTLEQIFIGKITKNKFSGQLVSLTYVQSQHAPNLGFIVLNLNYGEICEEQISIILEQFNCVAVFSGSAAGYIPTEAQEQLPEIGSRISVDVARHDSGELVVLNEKSKSVHLHVPTIFIETFDWLKQAKELGASTVDVETFYVLRAIQKYKKENPQASLHHDVGVFISDYVGEKPLRGYKNVFAHYPEVLQHFVNQALVANITAPYNHNRLSVPSFSSKYFELHPEKRSVSAELRNEAVVDAIGQLWDKAEFAKRVHTPVAIGAVKNTERFTTQAVQRCIHLPIKLPGSNIRIPKEYQSFADELQQMFDFEASINPKWGELYAYLTVDQGFVPRANSQRVPGPHVDGIPRDRDNPGAQLIDHAYLVTNAIPTMFYAQQFDMSAYDPKIHHFFAIFRALCDESRTMMVKPFEIMLMNAYSVHTPTQTQEDVNRTFIRLEFSTLKFDRKGNSINPYFAEDDAFPEYPFDYIPRPIPAHLFVPPSVYLDKPITNEDYTHESIDRFGRASMQAIFTQNPRVKLKQSDYKNLELLAKDMMSEENQGIVVCHRGIPHAFCLYKIENKTVKLHTLFTLMGGKGQELLFHMMNNLQKLADKLSLQAGLKEGETPITLVMNENNEKMLYFFLRAARLAKIEVNIEREESQSLLELTSPPGMMS